MQQSSYSCRTSLVNLSGSIVFNFFGWIFFELRRVSAYVVMRISNGHSAKLLCYFSAVTRPRKKPSNDSRANTAKVKPYPFSLTAWAALFTSCSTNGNPSMNND